MSNIINYGIVIVYVSILFGLSYLAYRRTKTSHDYLIGGGEVNPYLMALAYGASFISTSAIIGFGGAAGMYGMGLLWLTVLTIFIGVFVAFVLYGKRTVVLGKTLNVYTFPELLSKRYDSPAIRKLTASVILLFMPVYAAAVMIGAARFLQQVLGIDYHLAVIVFALVVSAYVSSGGLKAIYYTDAFQGTVMFLGMAALLGITYYQLGGVTPAHQTLTDLAQYVPVSLGEKGHLGWTRMPAFGSEYWWTLVSTLVMGVGIGVLAQPQLIIRYLSVRGAKQLNRAVVVGGVFILMMTGVAFVVGALTNVYFYQTTGQISLLAALDPATGKSNIDTIIPLYINSAMPQWLVYLFMLTLLSAAMSTLSGQLHLIGSSLSHDLTGSSTLKINRLGILAGVIVTVWLSFLLPGNIIASSTAIFFGVCASVFLPAYTAALFWPRSTKEGVISSMVTGLVVNLIWILFVNSRHAVAFGLCRLLFGVDSLLSFPWNVVDPLIIGLPLSALVLVGITLAGNRRVNNVIPIDHLEGRGE